MSSLKQISTVVMMAGAALLRLSSAAVMAGEANGQSNLTKEVIRSEGGIDRHWLIKSNALIVEEHGLTAHGDLHLMIEYPKGVRSPQLDSPNKDTNVEWVATMFWPSGTNMSRTPFVGDEPNGRDLLWWSNGKLFREAQFAMGTPTGIWKYYNEEGKLIGEGTFQEGKRLKGSFIGNDRPGYFFFFTDYPIKLQKFDRGVVKEEVDFLKELKLR